jgi:hypothetical protein
MKSDIPSSFAPSTETTPSVGSSKPVVSAVPDDDPELDGRDGKRSEELRVGELLAGVSRQSWKRRFSRRLDASFAGRFGGAKASRCGEARTKALAKSVAHDDVSQGVADEVIGGRMDFLVDESPELARKLVERRPPGMVAEEIGFVAPALQAMAEKGHRDPGAPHPMKENDGFALHEEIPSSRRATSRYTSRSESEKQQKTTSSGSGFFSRNALTVDCATAAASSMG